MNLKSKISLIKYNNNKITYLKIFLSFRKSINWKPSETRDYEEFVLMNYFDKDIIVLKRSLENQICTRSSLEAGY